MEDIQVDIKIMPSQISYRNMAEMQLILDNNITDLTDEYIDTSRIDVGDKYFYFD